MVYTKDPEYYRTYSIGLTDDQIEFVDNKATELGISNAEFVRNALRFYARKLEEAV